MMGWLARCLLVSDDGLMTRLVLSMDVRVSEEWWRKKMCL